MLWSMHVYSEFDSSNTFQTAVRKSWESRGMLHIPQMHCKGKRDHQLLTKAQKKKKKLVFHPDEHSCAGCSNT